MAAGAFLIGGVAIGYASGLRINTSASMPLGIWRIVPPSSIARGEIVTACPLMGPAVQQASQRGWIGPGACDTGLEPVLKVVVAVAGDVVDVAPDGSITVNGTPIADSAALSHDSQGRGMVRDLPGRSVVPAGSVWLVGRNLRSFDSRYFGPVEVNRIVGAASPVITR